MNIQGCIPRFIKGHGSLILTILSGLGLIGTVVVTAKQAPKAEKELREELNWKVHRKVDEMMDEAEANGHGSEEDDWTDDEHAELYDIAERDTQLTVMEKIKVAGPIYAPVILLGLGTLGCMAGAQILNTRQQAALIGAYALMQKEFGAYRQEIRDIHGEEADKKAFAESQKKIRMLESEVRRLEDIKNVQTFGISTLPGVIFRSDMANIERAFLHFNRNLLLRGWADLNELYSFLGLPEKGMEIIGRAPDEDYGWNCYINETQFGGGFLDYRLIDVVTVDGEVVKMIDFVIPPYRIDGENFEEDGPCDIYSGYLPEEARQMLKKGVEQIPFLIDYASHFVGAPAIA